MSRVIEWTEAHRREAFARLSELAAELIREGRDRAADYVGSAPYPPDESQFRRRLGGGMTDPDPAFLPARIDREVRRVDALATGRLVRETVWRMRWPDGIEVERKDRDRVRDLLRDNPKARSLRVTRIRRAR